MAAEYVAGGAVYVETGGRVWWWLYGFMRREEARSRIF
jgi:hypothetical protein